VLDADIAKCFDRINHKALLSKIHTYPTLRRQISGLKRGFVGRVNYSLPKKAHRKVELYRLYWQI
jgi:RNA-directed DNA polymerase